MDVSSRRSLNPAAGSTLPVSFVLIGNPNRPNGGILQRFEGLTVPFAGITFDGATPTNTDFKTVDITRQYDGALHAHLIGRDIVHAGLALGRLAGR